jgi:hypothetical protein
MTELELAEKLGAELCGEYVFDPAAGWFKVHGLGLVRVDRAEIVQRVIYFAKESRALVSSRQVEALYGSLLATGVCTATMWCSW